MTAAANAIRNQKLISDLQAEVAGLRKRFEEELEEIRMRFTILEQVVQKSLVKR